VNRPDLFGFSEFTTWPWSMREDLAGYATAGVNAIEVCEFKLPHNDFDMLGEIAKHGLQVASVQMHVHSVFTDSMASKPSDPSDRLEHMKRAIDASAPHLPGATPFVVITGIPPEGNIKKAVEQSVEAVKHLAEFAATRNVRIAFEPLSPVNLHTDTAVWGLDQGLELIDRVNHPAAGLCIDTWNVWQTPDLDDVIRQCKDRIFLVQLSDWQTPRSTADRFTLGEGVIPLARIMRCIRSTGFNGAWIVEILSSYHLPGSLWKRDQGDVLRENISAFERLWQTSEPELARLT